ncbi:leucine-rich repeat-containing protein 40 isoform X1 [Cherax quadricarinatus]|uniref:leucine-rich repeat-containing protein 40 isoform X1 n=2 Tax=Cherax quadricarinatus TaxID=27406 RepID=UPI0023798F66|nr:leucine-rich repeat-containing protein 40-like isoform X1 [Cherax quadricarinatus]XP_053645123.1 leucine-rich repeat-containing protein 40-like isoform X1 [Cherax quadricarinatus]XP_053645124.1 leucine-rich repeat-containing protein 40-like isoform X1 [Cherax quadricarinatus]
MSDEEEKINIGGSKSRLPAPCSRIPAPGSRLPGALVSKALGSVGRLPHPTATRPLAPLKMNHSQNSEQMTDQQTSQKPSKPLGTQRNRVSRGALRSGMRGVSRASIASSAVSHRSESSGSSRRDSDSVDEDGTKTPILSPPRKPASRGYSSVRARIRVRRGRPVMQGFANVGGVFDVAKSEDIHPQILKMARKSGQLNLSNRGMVEVPDKVYHIHEMDAEEAKKLTMNMTMDGNEDDRWWEQTDLTRLYLSSNRLSSISQKISNLLSLQVLDLSDNCLTTLPSTFGELTCLHRLNLSHNRLEELPAGVFLLPDLRSLQLDHNNLKTLSEDLGNLTVLEYLDVSHNSLTELPLSIGYLQKLTKFNASENQLKELPPEIGDCFALGQLDLTHNQLARLPDSIGNLRKLEQLYLRHNNIQVLPPLHSCASLKELHLGNNYIKELDAEQLSYLTTISVLDLRDNQIDDLPDQITLLQGLERLDITNNNLSTLPYHIGLLPHLKSMPLEGNPMRLIRRDIVQRGTVQLLKYLRSRVSAPINTFPGFENTSADTNLLLGNRSIPDKYQMRNTQTMCYNEKATEIPDLLFENAAEAEVRTVDLSKNQLTQVPDKMEMLSRHVSEIMLGLNKITSLPLWIGNFQRLQFLDLQGNHITDLPTNMAELLYLREINLTANRFEQLPACIYEMAQLEILCAADNQINIIYVEGLSKLKRLATLDLHNNNIDFIPPPLGNMTQLRSLQLHGNPFRVPRRAILDKGTYEILDYLRSRIVSE